MLHPGAYLRISWNQLDVVIVVTSLAALYSSSSHLAMIKVLRLLRALRPLRMISRFKVRGPGGVGQFQAFRMLQLSRQRLVGATWPQCAAAPSPLALITVLHLLLRAVPASVGLHASGLVGLQGCLR